jgi:beta-phosphoglucomutase-like phosphatase (HAD superfamily)
MAASPLRTILLDVDGTLVDTNYLHALAWQRAFRAAAGVELPAATLHRAVGMGGDKYVAHVAGDEVEERHGDAIRDAHSARYMELIDEVRPLPGARELVVALKERGLTVVLASSG